MAVSILEYFKVLKFANAVRMVLETTEAWKSNIFWTFPAYKLIGLLGKVNGSELYLKRNSGTCAYTCRNPELHLKFILAHLEALIEETE